LNLLEKENEKSHQNLDTSLNKAIADFKEDTRKHFSHQKSEYSEKLNDLNEKMAGSIADLHKQLDANSRSLLKEIGETKSEILESLDQLKTNKVDRSLLAGFLQNIAAGLEGKGAKTDAGKK